MAARRSPGEEKIIEGIREVVAEVTEPHFNAIKNQLSTLEKSFDKKFNDAQAHVDKKFAELMLRLPAPKP